MFKLHHSCGEGPLTRKAVNEFAIVGTQGLLTGNPFDTTRRPGTSSAGCAAAVSDYQCHVAIGSQTVILSSMLYLNVNR